MRQCISRGESHHVCYTALSSVGALRGGSAAPSSPPSPCTASSPAAASPATASPVAASPAAASPAAAAASAARRLRDRLPWFWARLSTAPFEAAAAASAAPKAAACDVPREPGPHCSGFGKNLPTFPPAPSFLESIRCTSGTGRKSASSSGDAARMAAAGEVGDRGSFFFFPFCASHSGLFAQQRSMSHTLRCGASVLIALGSVCERETR
mmetsp:Transcript_46450/g.153970  ORF Transcript_46450/g.153970 Transcript_46450/m.153970 type:complete len:210 (-) Transcript_46450:291-920(-)